MRELKFRQFINKTNMKFHYFSFEDGHIQGACSASLSVNPIEQYIGQKDKNGKEIYEGDKVNIFGTEYIVIFNNSCFMLDGYDTGEDYHYNDPLCTPWGACEIIGTIHD